MKRLVPFLVYFLGLLVYWVMRDETLPQTLSELLLTLIGVYCLGFTVFQIMTKAVFFGEPQVSRGFYRAMYGVRLVPLVWLFSLSQSMFQGTILLFELLCLALFEYALLTLAKRYSVGFVLAALLLPSLFVFSGLASAIPVMPILMISGGVTMGFHLLLLVNSKLFSPTNERIYKQILLFHY